MVKLKIVSAQTDFHTVVDLDEFIHVISFYEVNITYEDLTFVWKLLCLFQSGLWIYGYFGSNWFFFGWCYIL